VTKEFRRITLMSSHINKLILSILFIKMTIDLMLVCIDNFAFTKPLQSEYIDIFVMILYFMLVAYTSFLLFPTCSIFRQWKLMLWLLFICVVELFLIGNQWYQFLTCFLLIPQIKMNGSLPGSVKSGDKIMILLYLQYYIAVLGFTIF
jgi:hypothetical protein